MRHETSVTATLDPRQVEQQIEKRTWGRIRRLHVEMPGDRIVVHGLTNSYYSVQLVVTAVREMCDKTPVDLDIQVH